MFQNTAATSVPGFIMNCIMMKLRWIVLKRKIVLWCDQFYWNHWHHDLCHREIDHVIVWCYGTGIFTGVYVGFGETHGNIQMRFEELLTSNHISMNHKKHGLSPAAKLACQHFYIFGLLNKKRIWQISTFEMFLCIDKYRFLMICIHWF